MTNEISDFADPPWDEFIARTADNPTLPQLDATVTAVGSSGDSRLAIDLGFGGGRDTRALLAMGWRVFAVDAAPSAEPTLLARVSDDQKARLEIRIGKFHEVELPRADLVFSSFALPFATPRHIDESVDRAIDAVKPGGWLSIILFGQNDEWIGDEVAAVTQEWIENRLSGFAAVTIEETDEDGEFGGDGGVKHWHRYFILAQR